MNKRAWGLPVYYFAILALLYLPLLILLLCGIASSALYASMIWGIRYEGYSAISQVPSELTAIGAPTQALWARLGWIYTVLVAGFGLQTSYF